jgi:DNA-binding transcriptional ArsR family regulator
VCTVAMMMSSEVDARLVALFGSATRVRTLGMLANAYRPMTGYRIGQTAAVPLPKVYRELKRLRSGGLVEQTPDGWVLIDLDVRRLLRKRYRVAWASDWFEEVKRRIPDDEAILARLASLRAPRFPRHWAGRQSRRTRRDPRKDRRLARMGLGTSLHGDSTGV